MNTRVIAASLLFACIGPAASAQTFFFSSGGLIPDGTGGPNAYGPARVITATSNATQPIEDVVLTIGMHHPYVGDLRIKLSYTPTGSTTTYTATVIDRVGAVSTNTYGSNNDINGTFAFASGGTSFNNAASTFDNLTFGVYAPFKNNFNTTFPVVEFADFFRGLPGTGTWALAFEDGAEDYIGTVWNASIAVEARPLACIADLNTDGVVNTVDLAFFLGRFTQTCP